MPASVWPGFYSWPRWRSMASTPLWATDRFSEVPCSRSKLLREMAPHSSRSVELCRKDFPVGESRANRQLSAIKQRLAPESNPHRKLAPKVLPKSSSGRCGRISIDKRTSQHPFLSEITGNGVRCALPTCPYRSVESRFRLLPSCRRPGSYRGRLTDRQLSRFSSSNSDSVARKSEAAFRLYPASSFMSH